MSMFGDRLKSEREKRGWSQVLVAKKLGLKGSSTYANWEYGIREPDLEMIKKISELYETSVDELSGNVIREEVYVVDKENSLKESQISLAKRIYNRPKDQRKIIEDVLESFEKMDN